MDKDPVDFLLPVSEDLHDGDPEGGFFHSLLQQQIQDRHENDHRCTQHDDHRQHHGIHQCMSGFFNITFTYRCQDRPQIIGLLFLL